MVFIRSLVVCGVALGLVGCGDDGRRVTRDTPGSDAGTPDGAFTRPDFGPYECTPSGAEGTPETCSDGIDNDCNRKTDCVDVACSGVGSCPECGVVDTPLGSPLALPDGVGGSSCTTDADCSGGQSCFTIEGADRECRESYRSTLTFSGFGGATFDAPSDILSICVEMEHSWLRDLEIALEAPNGARIRLHDFGGRDGGEIYLGEANDCDDDESPSPGTGMTYCWRPDATRGSMLAYADGGGSLNSTSSACSPFPLPIDQLPAGDYEAADDWSTLVGSTLDGDWTLSVTDLWGIDNGYIFEWSIAFDPNKVADCSVPLI